MNVSSLTEKSKTLISDASNIAVQNRNAEITEFHMVDAMVNNENNLIYQLLKNMGVNVEELKENIENEIRLLPKITGNVAMRFSQEVEDELQESEKQAKNMKDEFISVEHIMLGIMEKCTPKLGRIFKLYRIDKHRFLIALKDVRGNVSVRTDTPENTYDVLLKFGKDVTDQARNNKLDPVIGRDEEIRNVMRILTRKTKNNPVLIGEPGVGKTAIVEGLAQRIVRGDVPTSLKDKHIYSLDLGLLVAGAKYKGEFEERLTSVMNELDKSEGNILLFIDEIHNLVGAGKSEGAMDASNLLKPKLSRGELHCMGATTLDEYREYIEKDPALARRFQPVMVNEPTVEDTITILRGIQEKFEIFHGVKIQDQALIAAATLSNRYITDRFLPDKAIDLIDEACAMVRTEMESMPIELDEISRKIMQHEIEEAALEREEDNSSKDQLAKVQKELAELRDKFTEMKAKWEEEKKNIARVKALKEQIDVVNAQIEQAERNYDLNKAAELKYSTLPNLKTVLEQEEKEAEKRQGGKSTLLRNKVTAEEIQQIVSRWTGIPVTKMQEGERLKIMNLESTLHESVIGQDEAVKKVTECIIRSRAGIANPNRPIGSFLFLGPTGVGKTELAKTLARTLFDDEKNMIRIDMSEYMEKFSVTRLIGAPPGYVGYEEGGQLTEAVRRKPYSVVLFDEVEKAHPDVFNIFLQILDDGRVTDSQGRLIDFKNTILILTSNLGSQYILDSISENGKITEEARNEINQALRTHFRPEFLNRLDETICFNPLGKEQVYNIVKLMLKDLSNRLAYKDIKFNITNEAIDFIIEIGYDVNFGARPLKRTIQSEVETLVSKAIIAKEINSGDNIEVYLNKEQEELELRKI
jgi:ATP-dependent Clp protease ATP-binding subunit ClpB